METGVATIERGFETLQFPISLFGIPATHKPVVILTPFRPADNDDGHYEDDTNVNMHLDTTINYNTSTKKWEFNVKRSIGANLVGDFGAEPMTFMWKVIAVKDTRYVGPSVTIVDETF